MQTPHGLPHTAQSLFSEQIAMRSGSGQDQDQHVFFDAINQQPIRENVTFPKPNPVASQAVIAILFRQRFAHGKQRDDFRKGFHFQAALLRQLVVLAKLHSNRKIILCAFAIKAVQKALAQSPSASKSENSSLTLW